MTPDGQVEPALVGPWTMGRDKKNPKPLDSSAFNTLVKTAAEFVRRHEQQLHATLHQSIAITHKSDRITVTLDIEPDDENPSAMLRAVDASGEPLAAVRVTPGFQAHAGERKRLGRGGFQREILAGATGLMGLSRARPTPIAQHSIDTNCTGPKGSRWMIAPETIATTGTMTEERPAMLAGSGPRWRTRRHCRSPWARA